MRVLQTWVSGCFSTGVLSESKSLQVSRTLLSILADLNNTLVWIVSTCPLISKSSCPRTNPFVTLYKEYQLQSLLQSPSCYMFCVFFSSLAKFMHLSLFSLFFQFYRVINRNGKVQYSVGSLFCCWLSLGLVVWMRLDDLFVSQIIIIIIIIIYSFGVFHISVSWWFFTGVWVTANFCKSPGLSSVFWSFSIMQSFGYSPLVR